MFTKRLFIVIGMVGMLLRGFFSSALAAQKTTTWTGLGDARDWFDSGNWDQGIPADNDTVIIGSGSVWLTNSTPELAAFEMTAGTLTFTNWTTILTATSVTVNGGAYYRGGGSHGGRGGYVALSVFEEPGPINGEAAAPMMPGSGGANTGNGHGGGVIRLDATGAVLIDGTLKANGGYANTTTYQGGGAGGSIYITGKTIAGNGTVTAMGGSTTLNGNKGGGGGGRIAVQYDPVVQDGVPLPGLTFSCDGGTGSSAGFRKGVSGTLYFTDTRFLTSTIDRLTGWVQSPGFTNWSIPGDLTIDNVAVRLAHETDGFALDVGGNLTISGNQGRLELGGDTQTLDDYNPYSSGRAPLSLTVGGNLDLENSAVLILYAARTNDPANMFTGSVHVDGDLTIASGAVLYPYSQPLDGGSVDIRARNVTVHGAINADAGGWRWRYGNLGFRAGTAVLGGAGYYRGGGGYGGEGGYVGSSWMYERGLTYGISNAPALPGSGGGGSGARGGKGGGLVHLQTGTLHLYGEITANGGWGDGTYVGGGSGGGIYLDITTLRGTGASLSARGGSATGTGNKGGGGGGRIAMRRRGTHYIGEINIDVAGGDGNSEGIKHGMPGTCWIHQPRGTIFTIR